MTSRQTFFEDRPGLAWAVWGILAALVTVPVVVALNSPWLPGRNPAYVMAGLAGILGLAMLLFQPLLAAGYLPGPGPLLARWLHRALGVGIVVAVLLHVAGLYVTSPPDTVDALLLVSPTPFSVYVVTAFWGVIVTAALVAARRRLGWRASTWRVVHNALAAMVVGSTVVHALLIEGTMGPVSKQILCAAVVVATAATLVHLRLVRPWRMRRRRSRDV